MSSMQTLPQQQLYTCHPPRLAQAPACRSCWPGSGPSQHALPFPRLILTPACRAAAGGCAARWGPKANTKKDTPEAPTSPISSDYYTLKPTQPPAESKHHAHRPPGAQARDPGDSPTRRPWARAHPTRPQPCSKTPPGPIGPSREHIKRRRAQAAAGAAHHLCSVGRARSRGAPRSAGRRGSPTATRARREEGAAPRTRQRGRARRPAGPRGSNGGARRRRRAVRAGAPVGPGGPRPSIFQYCTLWYGVRGARGPRGAPVQYFNVVCLLVCMRAYRPASCTCRRDGTGVTATRSRRSVPPPPPRQAGHVRLACSVTLVTYNVLMGKCKVAGYWCRPSWGDTYPGGTNAGWVRRVVSAFGGGSPSRGRSSHMPAMQHIALSVGTW